MSAIKDAFESRKTFLAGRGASLEQISHAEKQLGLSFAQEYREYLFSYGIAAYDGHELTGITQSERLNVVTVTKEAKARYASVPVDYYVIEQIGVEELIMWQSGSGEIYGCAPNYKLEKICDSLSAYIKEGV